MTVYFVATGVTQIPIGMLVDRIGAKRVLVARCWCTARQWCLPGWW